MYQTFTKSIMPNFNLLRRFGWKICLAKTKKNEKIAWDWGGEGGAMNLKSKILHKTYVWSLAYAKSLYQISTS